MINNEVGEYKKDNLRERLEVRRGEIMIWCKAYYYIDRQYLGMLKSWLKD